MATPEPLRLVTDQGEVIDEALVQRLRDRISGLDRDVATWQYRYAELSRDKEKEARDHKLWPEALGCFEYWRRECRHPNTEWTEDRFWTVLPFLRRRKHGRVKVLMAIAGAAYDPYTYVLKNGRQQRSDGWHKIFENTDTFERFCNKAPLDWKAPDLGGSPSADPLSSAALPDSNEE